MLKPAAFAMLLPALLGGCAHDAENFGVNSVNQPVVADGRASVPNCPNWHAAGRDSAAVTDSNYGCAVNSNLAAMVAFPQDLIHGRSAQPTDPDVAARAIKAWRETPPTGKAGIDKVSATSGSGGGQ